MDDSKIGFCEEHTEQIMETITCANARFHFYKAGMKPKQFTELVKYKQLGVASFQNNIAHRIGIFRNVFLGRRVRD